MEKRWPYRDRVSIAEWLHEIDDCLGCYADETTQGEIKLADYLKLAELNLLAADDGGKKVIVRWGNRNEENRERTGMDEDE